MYKFYFYGKEKVRKISFKERATLLEMPKENSSE